MAKMRAVPLCSMPNSRYWNADIVDEKKTMKEQVAAVTYHKKSDSLDQILAIVQSGMSRMIPELPQVLSQLEEEVG